MKGLALLAACPLCTNVGYAAGGVHCSYEEEAGPENWGKLDEHYSACSIGSQQSPLDIAGSVKAEIPDLAIDWKKGGHMENNGHTIQVNATAGGTLRRGEKTYGLVQYHFHAPSEHLVEGQNFPMEVHFVHKNAKTVALGVLGVFIKPGAANRTFAELAAAFLAQPVPHIPRSAMRDQPDSPELDRTFPARKTRVDPLIRHLSR